MCHGLLSTMLDQVFSKHPWFLWSCIYCFHSEFMESTFLRICHIQDSWSLKAVDVVGTWNFPHICFSFDVSINYPNCTCNDWYRCGSRIWLGGQLPRLKVAIIAKWSHTSEVSCLWLGSRACLRALEAFGFLMLKYVCSHILETLFL